MICVRKVGGSGVWGKKERKRKNDSRVQMGRKRERERERERERGRERDGGRGVEGCMTRNERVRD